ncbi:glutamate transporter polyphemus-like isoform X2 [Drosophila ficusphila]|uniref:glutamate transporter polyphemus-like isoform X2 n=1 Tax=Drosophila ficusphila TaxID=30025 RepID=UPI0007E722C5|nr:glutamate transporter polyphemus-like isoform X2 [Drosophila ficusphila]
MTDDRDIGAFILLVKCIIGIGVLALPLAFSYSGAILGIFLLILTSCIFIHGIHLLIYSMVECSRRTRVGYTNLPDSMVYAFSQGPKCFKYISKGAGLLGDVVLCLSAYLVCVVYLVFASSSTKVLVELYFPAIDIRFYIFIIGLVAIPPFCIMYLKYLIPFNFVANILIYSAFAMMSGYIFHDLPPFRDRNSFGDIAEIPKFLVRVIFSVTSVGVMLAIEKRMAKPQNFLGWFGIVNSAFLLVIITYIIFGFFGYWRYGNDVKGHITRNLPHEPLAMAVLAAFTIDVFLSIPLCGYVVIDIIMSHFWNKSGNLKHPLLKELILRICFMILATLNAIALPDLSAFAGAFTISLLNLIFPAFLEICLYYPEEYTYGKLKWKLVKNILMIIFGVYVLIQGLTVACFRIVRFYGGLPRTTRGSLKIGPRMGSTGANESFLMP